jgi:tetratricopeptide (TPR) repeat protein
MGFGTMFKANRAYRAQKNGNSAEAIRLYEECFAEGLTDPRYVLSYAVLIIREGQYQKAKDFLIAHQKAPGMSPDQRANLIVDFAVCCFRLGDLDKAVSKLEELYRKGPNGLVYQTLGYLYVERFSAEKKTAFLEEQSRKMAEEAAKEAARQAAEALKEGADQAPGEGAAENRREEDNASFPEGQAPAEEATRSPEEAAGALWEEGRRKALAFNQEAVEYDDEDPICLDNMGQFVYRVKEDKAGAKTWFEKALAIKDSQIDTLYFLSRYDLENGDKEAALEKLEKAAAGRFSPLNYCDKETVEKEIATLKGAN